MKGELLGRGVVMYLGNEHFTGHQLQGVLLVEANEDGSYTGISFPHNEGFQEFITGSGKTGFTSRKEQVGVTLRHIGLRQYPYTEQPNYSFQFVLPGEDPAPLLAIMTENAKIITQGGGDFQGRPVDLPEGEFDAADQNRDGIVTNREQRRYDEKHPKG